MLLSKIALVGITQDEIDNGGRIHKSTFVISISVFFVLCWIAAAVRFYVRLGIQRMFSVDDAFLIFGLACLTTAYGILLNTIGDIFVAGTYLGPNGAALALQPGFLDTTFYSVKMMDIVLILAWCSISCVKLSFLFLFRKLINRLRYMMIYWWFVFIYVLAVSGYGAAVYILVCPYFFDFRAIQCVQGPGLARIARYSISQISLDIIGDVMILMIPIHIIWKVKISLKQKFALATSLCLTIVIIAVTVTKAAGMRTGRWQQYDSIWNTYFNFLSAEIGLLMTSATAFRSLYLSKTGGTRYGRSTEGSRRSRLSGWWFKAKSRQRSQQIPAEGKELSEASDLSSGPERIHMEPPRMAPNILPRGQVSNNDDGYTENSGYQSKFRMTQIIEASWEDIESSATEIKDMPKAFIASRNHSTSERH